MRLHMTARSHFSRKVRVLLGALSLRAEEIDVGNVLLARQVGQNPLLKVPALEDGPNVVVFDSDAIARYVVRKFDPTDALQVLLADTCVRESNLRVVANGVMGADVELVLGARSGLDTRPGSNARFDRLRLTIEQGLAFIDNDLRVNEVSRFSGHHFVCMWDHLALYNLVPLSENQYPNLAKLVERDSKIPYVASTKPPPL